VEDEGGKNNVVVMDGWMDGWMRLIRWRSRKEKKAYNECM